MIFRNPDEREGGAAIGLVTDLAQSQFLVLSAAGGARTVQVVRGLMEKTNTGLRLTVDILDKAYEIGIKCAKGFK